MSRFLPFFLLRLNTLRPPGVLILALNPCLFLRFLMLGWNVRFILPPGSVGLRSNIYAKVGKVKPKHKMFIYDTLSSKNREKIS